MTVVLPLPPCHRTGHARACPTKGTRSAPRQQWRGPAGAAGQGVARVCHRVAMETVPGGVAGWGGPGAGLGGPPAAGVERTIRSRLAQAAVLAVLAALAGGLTYAMAHEVGLAAPHRPEGPGP